MADLRFADVVRDVDMVVFDKDGTLIDFDFTWGRRCQRAIDALIDERPARGAFRAEISRSLGLNPVTGRALSESPLVVGTIEQTTIVAATALYQRGEAWTTALQSAERWVRPMLKAATTANEVLVFPSVGPVFAALKAAGIKIGVLTNDDRAGTLSTLAHLQLLEQIDAVVCADDGHGGKPEPGGLLHIAALLGVSLEKMAMVGDAVGDLITARAAGHVYAVGVASGPAGRDVLSPHADIVLDGVGDIAIPAE